MSTAVAEMTRTERVADKCARYLVERDERHDDQCPFETGGAEAWRFTAKGDARQAHWVWRNPATGEWFYEGPPWKAHHRDLYFDAVRAILADAALLAAPSPPLPQNGLLETDRCPRCGAAWAWEQGHLGGRGYCWRAVCGCGHRTEWRS